MLAFLISIGIGIGAGFLFDFYRVARITWRLGRLGTSIGDLLIWVALTLVVFALLLLANWGEVRWYILLGLGLGALLYHRAFSRGGTFFWQRGLNIAERVGRVLVSPLFFTWRLIPRLCRLPARPCSYLRSKFKRSVPGPPDGVE